jgi:hypothetical protein
VDKSTLSGNQGTFLPADIGITPEPTSFIPPMVMDPSNSSTLYFGSFRVYQTTDGAATWTPISPPLTSNGTLTTIAVAPSNSNTVYAGSDDASVAVTTNASAGANSTWSLINSPSPRSVTDIAVDPASSTTTYVTYSGFSGFVDTVGHVFKTTNGGASFTDVSGNLPNIPVNAIVVDPDIANTLYIATDIGVFTTGTGGTTWTTLGRGLPNVAVIGLALHRASRTLRAGTHGRSAWDLSVPALSGFSLSLNPASVDIAAAGKSGSSTLTVSRMNNFTGSVGFACSVFPLPVNDPPTCFVNPPSVALSATATTATATLRIATKGGLSSELGPTNRPDKATYFAPSAGLALVCIFLLGVHRPRRRWAASLGLLVLVFLGVTLCNCGGGGGSSQIDFGTPSGAYTVTVTGSGIGSSPQSTSVSLTVQ